MKFTLRKGSTVVADDMNMISFGELTPIQGGSHIVPLMANNESIVLQLPKCCAKNGVITTSKKRYCDLEFNLQEHVLVTDWFSSFEEHCIDMLSERCGDWFGSGTSEADIEDLMLSSVKVHRDGKTFSIRTDIGGGSGMKIQYSDQCIAYDITGNQVSLDTIVAGSTIVPLLLLKCIKLAGAFSIDIQMTQVVVVEEQMCQIEIPKTEISEPDVSKPEVSEPDVSEPDVSESVVTNTSVDDENEPTDTVDKVNQMETNAENIEESVEGNIEEKKVNDEDKVDLDDSMMVVVDEKEPIGNINREVSGSESNSPSTDPIQVVDLNIDDITETAPIELMESKEVRVKMYKEAKRRAIAARKRAIEEIMRARNIKMEFMLDDEVDSESDVDSDFDSVYGDEEME